jgi:hypothetical protein
MAVATFPYRQKDVGPPTSSEIGNRRAASVVLMGSKTIESEPFEVARTVRIIRRSIRKAVISRPGGFEGVIEWPKD